MTPNPVFGVAASDPRPPASETARLQVAAHDGYHFAFAETVQGMNGFKWCSILPGHLDDAREISGFDIHTLSMNLIEAFWRCADTIQMGLRLAKVGSYETRVRNSGNGDGVGGHQP